MKRFTLDILKHRSNLSSMRLAFIISTVTACMLSIYLIIRTNVTWEEVTLITSLLGVSQTGKVLQKSKEYNSKGVIDEISGNGEESNTKD